MLHRLGRAARIAGALVFLLVLVPLGTVAYALLSLSCCGGRGGGVEPAGWIVIGAVVIVAALAAAGVAAALVQFICRLIVRRSSES